MAQFNKLVVTNKGQALAAQMIAQSGQIQFTHIRISDKTYNTSGLEGLTDIGQIKQAMEISRVIRTSDKVVQVEGAITNTDLTSGYYMQTVGLYAAQSGGGEILFAVTTAVKAGYMPPHDDLTTTGAYFKLLITVSNSNSVNLVVGSSATATIGDIRDLQRQITEGKNDLQKQITNNKKNYQTLINGLPQTIIDKYIDLLDNYVIYRRAADTKTYAIRTDTIPTRFFVDGYTYSEVGNVLTYVHLPFNLKSIGFEAFKSCGLCYINIPNSVTHISDNAFIFNNLTHVNIPISLTEINNGAFSYNGLMTLRLPEGIESIGKSAFEHNKITELWLPEKVKKIGDQAFAHNEIDTVYFPSGLAEIGSKAFDDNKLTEVTIPKKCTLAPDAFDSNVTIRRI